MNSLLRSSPETSAHKIPAFGKQIKSLKTKDPVPSLSPAHPCLPPFFPQGTYLCFLSPKFQGRFFYLCNLFPESTQSSWLTSSTAHFFYLCDFLNKPSLIFKFLALHSFLARLKDRGLTSLVTSDAICH